MVRNVRNFWFEADIDGRDTSMSGGPVAADGGMTIRIYQRVKGEPHLQLEIDCNVLGAEKDRLQLVVTDMHTKVSTFICPSRR